MYVGEIMKADCANGTGTRVSVFVSGCLNHCKGCFQPQTWDFHYGIPFTPELEDMVLKELSESYYEGLTILGGEPFELQNQPDVLALILRVKKELPEKNIWMYTGYTYHQDLVPGTTNRNIIHLIITAFYKSTQINLESCHCRYYFC